MKYTPGCFVSPASVLCTPCAGLGLLEPRELEEGEAVGTCDKCGTSIAVYADLANDQLAVRSLREAGFDAEHAHTGGGCHGVWIPLPDRDALMLVHDEVEPESAYLWAYTDEDGDMDDWSDDLKAPQVVQRVRSLSAMWAARRHILRTFAVGDRVQVEETRPVVNGEVPAGHCGTVVEVSGDRHAVLLSVRLDAEVPALSECGNCLHWLAEDCEDGLPAVAKIDDGERLGRYNATSEAALLLHGAQDEDEVEGRLADAEQDALADESRGDDHARACFALLAAEVERLSLH